MENFNLKKYLTENKLTEKVVGETSLNEGALDFTSEEIEILKDGLSAILNYQEGVAPDEYIDAVRALEAKLG